VLIYFAILSKSGQKQSIEIFRTAINKPEVILNDKMITSFFVEEAQRQ
jgi:ABC-type methionine transport system ATPase subunit